MPCGVGILLCCAYKNEWIWNQQSKTENERVWMSEQDANSNVTVSD